MRRVIEAFNEYLIINKGLSKNSIKAYTKDIEQFGFYIKKDLLKVDTFDVVEFIKKFKNSRTRNRKLSSINAFYNFCKELEFSTIDIKLSSSKVPSTLPIYLEHQAIMDAVEHIEPNNWLGSRDRALLLFLYATGVRVSEAVNAQREDLQNSWLKIRFAKGEKERLVPIAKIAQLALELYLRDRKDNHSNLFINYKKMPLSRISIFKITKKYLGVSPHVLRHSYASSLIIGGADLRVVQELLGHSSLVTTQIYTHIQKPHLRDTINRYHPLANK